MKTRTFRVILVTASAALLTAIGVAGAGMSSTALAEPRVVPLAPAQTTVQAPAGDEPSCMIESWLCNPQPGEPWPSPTPTPGPTAAGPSSVPWSEIAAPAMTPLS